MTDEELQAIRVHVEEDSATQFEAAALLAEVDRLRQVERAWGHLHPGIRAMARETAARTATQT